MLAPLRGSTRTPGWRPGIFFVNRRLRDLSGFWGEPRSLGLKQTAKKPRIKQAHYCAPMRRRAREASDATSGSLSVSRGRSFSAEALSPIIPSVRQSLLRTSGLSSFR